MTRSVLARAPGKLFLLGEYAVLDGSPAVIAAVDRFAEVDLTPDIQAGRFRLEAPQLGSAIDAPAHRLPDIEGPLRFALAALQQIDADERAQMLDGVRLTISSQLSSIDGAKPGLGSSAAVTVAVSAALFRVQHPAPLDDAGRQVIFERAVRAHRTAQGGAGSGGDIAASVYGGLVQLHPNGNGLPTVTRLPLPAGVDLLAAWTGTPASTTDLIAHYRALNNGHTKQRERFVADSRSLVQAFTAALGNGGSGVDSLDAAGASFEAFAAATKLPAVTPALRDLLDIARRHHAAAKISGAGGGDCGIALCGDPEAADRIRTEWYAAGLFPLPLRISAEGVTCADR